eukprot:5208745-Amphidinium_carterae.1
MRNAPSELTPWPGISNSQTLLVHQEQEWRLPCPPRAGVARAPWLEPPDLEAADPGTRSQLCKTEHHRLSIPSWRLGPECRTRHRCAQSDASGAGACHLPQ